MSSTGTPKQSPSTTRSLKEQAISSVREAVDLADLGGCVAEEMLALFKAIHKLAQHDETILGLARIGIYLADDRLNMFDLSSEKLKEQLALLKGASHD